MLYGTIIFIISNTSDDRTKRATFWVMWGKYTEHNVYFWPCSCQGHPWANQCCCRFPQYDIFMMLHLLQIAEGLFESSSKFLLQIFDTKDLVEIFFLILRI